MPVADIGGEEFQEALARVVIGRRDDGRQRARGGSERYQIRHALPSVSVYDNGEDCIRSAQVDRPSGASDSRNQAPV
jgi:hypothetical protein